MTTGQKKSSSPSKRGRSTLEAKPIVLVQAVAPIDGKGLMSGASVERFNGTYQPVKIKIGTAGIVVDELPNDMVKVAFEHGGRATVEIDVPRNHLNF